MGLDMYLTADVYVGAKWHNVKTKSIVVSKRHRVEFSEGEKDDFKEVNKFPTAKISSISYDVGYWRKVNCVHKWFVDNVQGGVDNCERYRVDDEKLVELKGLCEKLLTNKNKEEALKLLPPQDGFFFGATNTDDNEFWKWYWADLEDTVKQLEEALKFGKKYCATFYYQSSW